MKYTAVIAIMDEVLDSYGEYLSQNVKMPNGRIKVTNEFQGDPIGSATVEKIGNTILAEIDIDDSVCPPELVELLHGVIGGSQVSKVGPRVDNWILKEMAITKNPSDKRLPLLKRKK